MKIVLLTLSLLAAVLFLSGCGSTPASAPDDDAPARVDVVQTADEIAAHLLSGNVAAAEGLITRVGEQADYEAVFAVLYDRAEALASERDYDSCIRINQFLVDTYPDERTAKEALLYSLWLYRAQSGRPFDPGTVKEIESEAARLRGDGGPVPVWVDIALTQAAIDGGDIPTARAAMDRFNARWDREPPALRTYVGELERYIETHHQN